MSLKTVYVSIYRPGFHGLISVGFSKRINERGTDFGIYTNNSYSPQNGDTELLIALIEDLRSAELGINTIRVEPCELKLFTSGAASDERVKRVAYKAVRSVGLRPKAV